MKKLGLLVVTMALVIGVGAPSARAALPDPSFGTAGTAAFAIAGDVAVADTALLPEVGWSPSGTRPG